MIPQLIKDTAQYIWNDNDTLRFFRKLITCPFLGPGYIRRSLKHHTCVKQSYSPSKRQLKQYAVLADEEQRRRVRRSAERKRSVSVDGKRWWNKMAKDQLQSSFFAKLPVELRLKIYEMVLCDQEEFAMKFNEHEPWDYWDVRAEPGCDTSMLRTCKNIYSEAVPVLYSKNTFRFDSYTMLSSFTSTIPPQRLASIRQVVLSVTIFWYRDWGFTMHYEKSLELLGNLRGLRDVCLRYRLRKNNYVKYPRLDDFGLLEKLEKEERTREYNMFYEMREVQTGPEIGGMLFDRWAVGERRSIAMAR